MRFDFRLFAASLFGVYALLATTLGAEPVMLGEELKELNITANLEYVLDRGNKLSFRRIRKSEGIKWLTSTEANIGLGYEKAAAWVRFTVKNNSSKPRQFVLEEGFHLTDHFDVYIPQGSEAYKIIRTGSALPFKHRPLRHRTLAFDLNLSPGQSNTYYLRYKTKDNLVISLKISSLNRFDEYRISENAIMWLYYGVMSIMFVYNCFLLFSIRNFSYLCYSTYILSVLFMSLSLNGHGFQHLWPELPGLNRLILSTSASMGMASIILFVRYFIETKKYNKFMDRLLLGMAFLDLFYTLFFFVTPYWQATIQSLVFLAAFENLILLGILIYLAVYLKSRSAYFVLMALFVLIFGAMIFALRVTQIVPNNYITTYGIQLGSAIDVALLSFALADKINYMRKMRDKAENKYRHLVESSSEIIFTLDHEFKFLTANSALQEFLGFNREDIIGKPFTEFVYELKGELHHYSRSIAREYLNNIWFTKTPVSFKTNLKGLYNPEPSPFTIDLQFIQLEQESEILGRASADTEDALYDDIRAETQFYDMSNYFSNADLISHRLTRYLEKFLAASDVLSLRVALREILINSIEHGNLNMSFVEKSESLERNTYFEVLRSRQTDPENSKKKVRIEYSLSEEHIGFRISDEGAGFDHKLFFVTAEKNARDAKLLHGRGLLMCQTEFDVMEFNDKGNCITVIKYLSERRDTAGEIFSSGG